MHPIGSSRAALCGGHLEHGFPANAPAESRSLHWNASCCGRKRDRKTFHSSAPRRRALQSQAGGIRRQRCHSLRISDASPHGALTTPSPRGCTVTNSFAAAPRLSAPRAEPPPHSAAWRPLQRPAQQRYCAHAQSQQKSAEETRAQHERTPARRAAVGWAQLSGSRFFTCPVCISCFNSTAER